MPLGGTGLPGSGTLIASWAVAGELDSVQLLSVHSEWVYYAQVLCGSWAGEGGSEPTEVSGSSAHFQGWILNQCDTAGRQAQSGRERRGSSYAMSEPQTTRPVVAGERA